MGMIHLCLEEKIDLSRVYTALEIPKKIGGK